LHIEIPLWAARQRICRQRRRQHARTIKKVKRPSVRTVIRMRFN
jgi:hypothetical protein